VAGDIHHVRVYVIETKKGRELAFVPIYAHDVVQAMEDARNGDSAGDRRSTSIRLRPECASFRSSRAKGANRVRALLAAGRPARQVAWIAPGDELWLGDPSVVTAVPKDAMPEEWRGQQRWFCTGSEKLRLNVRPVIVSADLPRGADGEERMAPRTCLLPWEKLATTATLVRRDPLGGLVTVQRLRDLLE